MNASDRQEGDDAGEPALSRSCSRSSSRPPAAATAEMLDPSFGGDCIVIDRDRARRRSSPRRSTSAERLRSSSPALARTTLAVAATSRATANSTRASRRGRRCDHSVSPGLDESASVVAVAGGKCSRAGRAFTGSQSGLRHRALHARRRPRSEELRRRRHRHAPRSAPGPTRSSRSLVPPAAR